MCRGEVRRAKEARRQEPGKILDREYYEVEETYKGEFEDIDPFRIRTYRY